VDGALSCALGVQWVVVESTGAAHSGTKTSRRADEPVATYGQAANQPITADCVH